MGLAAAIAGWRCAAQRRLEILRARRAAAGSAVRCAGRRAPDPGFHQAAGPGAGTAPVAADAMGARLRAPRRELQPAPAAANAAARTRHRTATRLPGSPGSLPAVTAHPVTADEPALLPAQTVWLLLGGFLGAVLLNAHHTALWCVPLALAAVAWRVRRLRVAPRLPARYLRIGVAGLLTLAVLVGFHTLNGIDAGSSLLVAMATLKLTETVRRRDWLIVLGAALFLLLAACLDGQALWLLPLYAAELWVLCAALYGLGAGADAPPVRALLRRSALSLVAALPFALLLFLFVPRLSGSFWAIPRSDQAYTGLGDEMSPGSISQLTQSGDAALRVRFDGALPPPAERYWRGPVLHDFDGYTWRRHRAELGRAPRLQFLGPAYSYEVTLEPNQHNVLIALELPQALPDTLPNAYP